MEQAPVDQTLNLFDRFAKEGMARLVSDLANPLFMPPAVLLGACILLNQSLAVTVLIVSTGAICYTIIPFGLTLYLFRTRIIHSLDLPLRTTRTTLYAFSLGSATCASTGIYYLISGVHSFLFILSLIFLANLSIAFLLNLQWKVSIHSASVAVAGTTYSMMFFWGITGYPDFTLILSLIHLLLLLPVVMWARYHLRVHSFAELLGGTAAGILLTIIELNIFTAIW